MATTVDIYIESCVDGTPLIEPIQRSVLHTKEGLPDPNSLQSHVDSLLESCEIEGYTVAEIHDSEDPCIIGTFCEGGEKFCIRVSPCLCDREKYRSSPTPVVEDISLCVIS
jgi:hypothetical protein